MNSRTSARPVVIAVDGPAASGKGTLARRLAAHYGLPHLDTGLLYRGVAAALLGKSLPLDDVIAAEAAARNLELDTLDDEALRGREMGEAASVVAAHRDVRAALLRRQRTFAGGAKGAVLDGRDIGTVICPDADVKLYVTASPEVRAARRLKELAARGEAVAFEHILRDIRRRDARDSGRADAPLRMADDAVSLDTSALTIDEAFAAATRIARRRLGE